ncbi:hypothetical protein DY000_02025003 [Brassica cretica]|uniref:Uncharacterized protein n=1 Tax=Brassica cretica TaxID=69181 RepID=A0ABQ7E6B6_BRACR|nr:hypothetical protein DY000_02025003 [Brassica cretica]
MISRWDSYDATRAVNGQECQAWKRTDGGFKIYCGGGARCALPTNNRSQLASPRGLGVCCDVGF